MSRRIARPGRLAATIRGTGTAWTDGVPIGPVYAVAQDADLLDLFARKDHRDLLRPAGPLDLAQLRQLRQEALKVLAVEAAVGKAGRVRICRSSSRVAPVNAPSGSSFRRAARNSWSHRSASAGMALRTS